jgi:hypothetical protein
MKKMLLAALLLSLATTSLNAETSDWVSGYEAVKTWKKLKRQGHTPMAIECRDTGRKGLNIGDLEYRITTEKLDKKVHWMWAVGSDFGKFQHKAEKNGYTRVSYSAFRRVKSGLLVRCGVWHKDK